MPLWPRDYTLDELNRIADDNLIGHLGIEICTIGDDFLSARMPVDRRTCQPFCILHGGASVALAETVGSLAAYLTLSDRTLTTVGLEINANHLRPVTTGWVTGTARPLHLGRTTQVWEIRICDEQGRLVCISRHTVAIVTRRPCPEEEPPAAGNG